MKIREVALMGTGFAVCKMCERRVVVVTDQIIMEVLRYVMPNGMPRKSLIESADGVYLCCRCQTLNEKLLIAQRVLKITIYRVFG